MARRNRNDKLTQNRKKSANWLINFRIPEEYSSSPLFAGKKPGDLFQRSTGESDYREATRVRDRLFQKYQIFQPEWTPQEAYTNVSQGDFIPNDDLREELIGTVIEAGIDGTSDNTVAHAVLEGLNHRELVETDPLNVPTSRFGATLRHSTNQYREYRLDLPQKTLAKLDKASERLLRFLNRSDVSLTDLRAKDIFRYLSHCSKELKLSRSTISNDLSFLGQAFDLTQKQGLINDQLKNPFREQAIPPTTTKAKPRLAMPLEHATGLFKACKTKDQKLLVAISHYCGTRISEAFYAKICFGESYGEYLSVAENGTGKTAAATREIPISEGLRETLESLGIETRPNEPITLPWRVKTISGLDKAFRAIKGPYFESLDIEHKLTLTDHSFRHAFATYTANKFGELSAASLTGHKGSERAFTELARRYFHGTPWEHRREVVEVIPRLT